MTETTMLAYPFITPPQHSRAILGFTCAAPASSGVYGWFFREIPPVVPVSGCLVADGLTLLYVGISPKQMPEGRTSTQTVRSRIRYHYTGNAEGSTLRLTLGCLLAEKLGIELRRVGSGKRMTFTLEGERKLSAWIAENAYAAWTENTRPWELEAQLIASLSLPLNLDQNQHHGFSAELSRIRSQARRRARQLDIA